MDWKEKYQSSNRNKGHNQTDLTMTKISFNAKRFCCSYLKGLAGTFNHFVFMIMQFWHGSCRKKYTYSALALRQKLHESRGLCLGLLRCNAIFCIGGLTHTEDARVIDVERFTFLSLPSRKALCLWIWSRAENKQDQYENLTDHMTIYYTLNWLITFVLKSTKILIKKLWNEIDLLASFSKQWCRP